MCSVALLLSFPVLFLCVFAGKGSLWWVPGMEDADSMKFARSTAGALALVLFTGGLEGRVIFHGFGEYVRLPGVVGIGMVTLAVYGGLLAAIAALSGVVGAKNGVPTAVSYTHLTLPTILLV